MWATSSGLNTDSTSDKNTFTNTLISKAMITKDIQEATNKQINAELWSAYLYLSMAMDAESKMYRGVANWFFIQCLEEQDHARIFQNFMNDCGARVILAPIEKVTNEWDSPLEMFQDSLKHEQEVTSMIIELVRLAVKEKDYATLSRLKWFVDEQVEEEKNARKQVADFSRAGDDFGILTSLDAALSTRKYCTPLPLQ